MSLGTIVITGGTSGIGLGIAIEAIKLGARVVVASSTQAKIDAAVTHLNSLAGSSSSSSTRAFGFQIDLSHEATLESNIIALLTFASSQAVTGNTSGKINHVAHTAGPTPSMTTLQDWKPEGYYSSWTIKYSAALAIAKHAPKYLVPGDKSSITLTSGTLVEKPIPGVAVMIGSSAATEALARALAIDLAPLRVNVVAPGAIDTPMMHVFGAEQLQFWNKDTLRGRMASPEESAQPYIYFMKDSFATGLTLRSDGGRLLKTAF